MRSIIVVLVGIVLTGGQAVAAECPNGFDCTGLDRLPQRVVQQFSLESGIAQIGHVPGKTDVLRPNVKPLWPAQHVSFELTVRWPEAAYNPCSEAQGCVVTVGLRDRIDEVVFTWSTFTLHTDATPLLRLSLPSQADDVLPAGYHDVFVRITGRGHTLGIWYVPVVIGTK